MIGSQAFTLQAFGQSNALSTLGETPPASSAKSVIPYADRKPQAARNDTVQNGRNEGGSKPIHDATATSNVLGYATGAKPPAPTKPSPHPVRDAEPTNTALDAIRSTEAERQSSSLDFSEKSERNLVTAPNGARDFSAGTKSPAQEKPSQPSVIEASQSNDMLDADRPAAFAQSSPPTTTDPSTSQSPASSGGAQAHHEAMLSALRSDSGGETSTSEAVTDTPKAQEASATPAVSQIANTSEDPFNEPHLPNTVLDALRATATDEKALTSSEATRSDTPPPAQPTSQASLVPSVTPPSEALAGVAGLPASSWASMPLRLRTSDIEPSGFEQPQAIVRAPAPAVSNNAQSLTAASAETVVSVSPAHGKTPTPPAASADLVTREVIAVAATAAPDIGPTSIEVIEPLPAVAPLELKAAASPPAARPQPTPPGRPGDTLNAPAPSPAVAAEPNRLSVALNDADEPETLSIAILSALQKNPEIQIAEAQRDEALYGVDESRAAMLPNVTLNAAQGRERRTTDDPSEQAGLNTRSEFTVSLRQNLFDFGSAHDALRSAASVAQSAEWSYRGQIDQVALRIAGTFHQLVERQNLVTLAEENLAAHEAILRTVQTQREFGMVTGADVSRIEARLNAAKSDLADRRSALDQAREDYRRLLDRSPGIVKPPEGFEELIPADVEEAVRMTESRNPQVMQARLLVDSLHQQRAAQQNGGLPRLDLELEGSRRNNVGGETGRSEEARAMVSVRVPLFDGGARQAGVNRLTARIRQAQFQVERAERDAEQAVRNDYSALVAAKGKTASIDAEVAAAERLVGLYQEQFRTGSRSVFDLLDSQSTLYQAQVKRETNRTEVRMSAYRVLSTLGSLVQTITQADKVNVRLFPATEPTRIRSSRPTDSFSPR